MAQVFKIHKGEVNIAVWGHPYSELEAGKESAADARAWLGRLREAGVTVYIPFVISGGRHYFESSVLGPPERDLLGPVLEAGQSLGMEVHPIVGLGTVGVRGKDGGVYEPVDVYGRGEEIPEWAKDWPCAVWEENRTLTEEVAEDLMATYRPDGLHMDYIRYPNSIVLDAYPCGCPRCREERVKWLGKELPDAEDLARPGVVYKEVQMRGRFVRNLVERLRGVTHKAGIPLSMAARARYLKDAVPEGQDWAEWARDGLVDIVTPMSYNPCFDRFQRFVSEHLPLLRDTGATYWAGIGRRSSLGVIDAEMMERQIRYALDQGADGVCLFHAAALEKEDLGVLASLQGKTEAENPSLHGAAVWQPSGRKR